jgi:hypothetical protein
VGKLFADGVYIFACNEETLAHYLWVYILRVVLAGEHILALSADDAGLYNVLPLYGNLLAFAFDMHQVLQSARAWADVYSAGAYCRC